VGMAAQRVCKAAKVPEVTAHGMRGLHGTLAVERAPLRTSWRRPSVTSRRPRRAKVTSRAKRSPAPTRTSRRRSLVSEKKKIVEMNGSNRRPPECDFGAN